MALTGGKGPLAIRLGLDWKYSDDTVMHIATARALVQGRPADPLPALATALAREYKQCSRCMSGRAPGKTCMKALSIIQEDGSNWNKIPFAELKGGGCGAAMRAACIGLYLHRDHEKLVALAVEAGRITHHNPIGYLGSVVAAYFTALALQKAPIATWPARLFEFCFPAARRWVEAAGREVKSNLENGQWAKFEEAWRSYAQARRLSLDSSEKS